jgi:hypothetical protein
MDRNGLHSAKGICKNPSTAVEWIFNGFLVAGSRFIVIISRVGYDIFGTFLLPQSYIIIPIANLIDPSRIFLSRS